MNEAPVAENQSVAVPTVTPTAAPAIPVVEKEPMKSKVTVTELAAAVAAVKPFINSRPSLPILSNVCLTQTKGRLAFHATNLDCSIVTAIESDSMKQGSTTLPVRQLADILKGCKDDVWIETDKHDKISIASGGTSSTVLGLPAEEYPSSKTCRADREEQIPQGLFKTMLDRVRRCQSTDETRYVLNGVLLERKAGKVRVVATDARRLAVSERETDIVGQDFACIIPRDTVDKVFRLLQADGEGVFGSLKIEVEYDQEAFDKAVKEAVKQKWPEPVLCSENNGLRIRFSFDAKIGKNSKAVTLPVVVTSRTIQGTYPNYRQVIPTECLECIEIPRKELADRVAQVATNVRCDNQPIVRLTFTKKLLTVLTRNNDGGESKSAIELQHVPTKERVIAFNPGYLIDALQSVPEHETVLLEMTDELSPGMFKINGENWTYVLMPMRAN